MRGVLDRNLERRLWMQQPGSNWMLINLHFTEESGILGKKKAAKIKGLLEKRKLGTRRHVEQRDLRREHQALGALVESVWARQGGGQKGLGAAWGAHHRS